MNSLDQSTEEAAGERLSEAMEFDWEAEALKFPTNSEIAAVGVAAFASGFERLPDDLRHKLLRVPGLDGAILGWDCARHVNSLPKPGVRYSPVLAQDQKDLWTRGEIRQIQAAFNGDVFHVRSVTLKHVNLPCEPIFDWVNLPGTARVVEHHPAYFPQRALDNPAEWARRLRPDQQKKVDAYHEQLGLLSGLPETAVDRYIVLDTVLSRDQNLGRLWGAFRAHFHFHLAGHETWDEGQTDELTTEFQRVIENEHERQVVLDAIDFQVNRESEWRVRGVKPQAILLADEDYHYWQRREFWLQRQRAQYAEALAPLKQ